MIFLVLSGCTSSTVRFPPDLWGEVDTGIRFDSGDSGLPTEETDTDTDVADTDLPDETAIPSDTAAPADTDPVIPPVQGVPQTVDIATATCDPLDAAFLFDVITFSWTGGATVFIQDPANPSGMESHPMRLANTDAGGAWDWYQVGPLFDQVAAVDFLPAQNTTFDCAARADLSYGVVLRDRFDVVSDCRVWGADSAALTTAITSEVPGLSTADCTPL